MKNRFRKVIATGEAGFSPIEILMGIGITVILAGIVTVTLISQRDKAFDAAVRSDLQSAATAAQTYYADAYSYPTETTGFASDNVTPPASDGTSYAAFVSNDAGAAGYVIYGLSKSGQLFALSSWDGNVPEKVDGNELPSDVPSGTDLGVPSGTDLGSSITWGDSE